MDRSGRRRALGAALCGWLLFAGATADAEVQVSVTVAFGSAVACGVGAYVYASGSWESMLGGAPALPTSLVEISPGGFALGVPLIQPGLRSDPRDDPPGKAEGVRVELLRWRF